MFKLEIETDNDAFANRELEVARILRELAHQIETVARSTTLQRSLGSRVCDINGNVVGEWVLR